ncbi:MAG: helix-turn-helix domain-containing protein [Candidatus Hydrothermarchaeales archaeon]
MLEAVLSVKIPECIDDISAKYAAKIKILGCVPFSKGGVKDLVEIRAPQESMDDVVEEIKEHPHFSEVDVALTGGDRALATFSTDRCGLCSAIAGSGCFLISATTKEGNINWTVLASNNETLKDLVTRIKTNGFEVKIIKVKELKSREALTSRQEEIVRIALEKGYFDFPKRISIRELADLFGVSISTLSEILRAGQKKILISHFREG